MRATKAYRDDSDARDGNMRSQRSTRSSISSNLVNENQDLDQSPVYTSEEGSPIEFGESSMAGPMSVQPRGQGSTNEAIDPPSYEYARVSTRQAHACPKLCILFQVVTFREDTGAYISIAYKLLQCGHHVRIATFEESRHVVEKYGIEFFGVGDESTDIMRYMLTNTPNPSTQGSRQRRAFRSMLELSWQSCIQPGTRNAVLGTKHEQYTNQPFVADVIVASPLAVAQIHCAEKLGVPLQLVSTIPYTPTSAFSHPLSASGVPSYSSYALFDASLSARIHSAVNKFRQHTLGLERLDPTDGLGKLDRCRVPTIYCWSDSLVARPKDWTQNIVISGLCTLPPNEADTPSTALQEFVQHGDQPIYIHLRSLPGKKRQAVFESLIEAIRSMGVRAVIHHEPADDDISLFATEDTLLVEHCPSEWILKHVSCVVHDGSSHITSAALLAGTPAVVVPYYGDQVFWSKMIKKVGSGSAYLSHRRLKRRSIADALELVMSPSCRERALRISGALSTENGPKIAAETILTTSLSKFRKCSLDPSSAAVWRLVQNGRECKLSTFSAATLAERQFIKVDRLERIRVSEVQPSPGPVEPLTGAAIAVSQLLYNAMKGCGSILGEFGSSAAQVDRLGQRGIDHPSKKDSNYVVGSKFLRGSGKIVKASLRSPMTFSFALAQGSHNAPRLWSDQTVREHYAVTGVRSGIAAGCKGLVLGTYDGVAGLITQPCIGAKEKGILGAVQGVGKGLASLPFKFLSAASAPVGYPLKGLDVAFTRSRPAESDDVINTARVKQGEFEYAEATLAQKQHIIQRWIAWQQGARFE